VRAVRVHVLLDGRDVPERSALGYVDALEELLETLRRAATATTGSRRAAAACS
jgi:2,3-bisphosphoglycerate-independent phosphoglycerate mutase